MSLLFMEGFEHLTLAQVGTKWGNLSNLVNSSLTTSSGRRPNSTYLSLGGGNYLGKSLSNMKTIVVGSAYKTQTLGSDVMQFYDNSTGATQILVHHNSDGSFSVFRSSTSNLIGQTATGLIAANGWGYLEAKVTIGTTDGAIVLRWNGSVVLTLSSVNTQATANAYCNYFVLPAASGFTHYFDDVYICDTSGTTNNNFLGDCRVDTLFPTADGTYSQFSPSTGTAHYANVDDQTPNTTDYNTGANVGDRDSYQLGDLATLTSAAVFGVQVNAGVFSDVAGTRSIAPFIRTGSANKDGTSSPITTALANYTAIFETDASGAALTASTVNAMEAGVLVAV